MTVVTKLASERWKNMTSEEKKPYIDKAKASKEEYRNLKSEMEEVVRLAKQDETSTRTSETSQDKSDQPEASRSRYKETEAEGRRESGDKESSGLKQLWQLHEQRNHLQSLMNLISN